MQLDKAMHILPNQGDLTDASYVLRRVGLFAPMGDGGMIPINAGQIAEFVNSTWGLISPYQLDAALLASDAYVDEYHRSKNKSTDAPWNWPKSVRDLQILDAEAARAIKAVAGG